MFILCCIWFIVAFLWITITSALDKEWMIDGRGINNVCDVLMYLEDDDTRDVGVIMTLPLFSLFSGSLCGEKNAAGLCTPPRWLFSAIGCGSFSALSVLLISRMGSSGHKDLTNFPPDDLCPQKLMFSPFVYR